MEKIRNLSLKKTMILYMAVSLIISFLLSVVIVKTAEITQQRVWWKYIDQEEYFDAINQEKNYIVTIRRPGSGEMNKIDNKISEFCDFLETYTVLFLAVIGSFVSVGLFYRNKLKPPIQELKEASKMIAGNDLNFHITYQNKDELGHLCIEFERMRTQLEENNRVVWRLLEDEKALRAAMAHDIRSPLSVLEGYQEMLLKFIEEDALDKEEILEMLQAQGKQMERMHRFIETMRSMARLQERELFYAKIDADDLKEQIKEETQALGRTAGIVCEVCMKTERKSFCIDRELVLEVMENLFMNALRYAKKKIDIIISSEEDRLILTVCDDGNGFKEGPEKLTKAFYYSNLGDDLKHFGIGLYLCRVYCERHGGRLLLGNAEQGGAYAKAVFQLNKEKSGHARFADLTGSKK